MTDDEALDEINQRLDEIKRIFAGTGVSGESIRTHGPPRFPREGSLKEQAPKPR
ncbi:hypothetical protein [Caballeronia glathei]|uniref:hypothetical protein n=1 Tax=Caballeronia glathei TaxID=60547 RepID=UPI001378D23A|nr:hypothetical protein [Caballeronia glathei]